MFRFARFSALGHLGCLVRGADEPGPAHARLRLREPGPTAMWHQYIDGEPPQ